MARLNEDPLVAAVERLLVVLRKLLIPSVDDPAVRVVERED